MLSFPSLLIAEPEIHARFDPTHPPGRLLDIGGYRLHLHCEGDSGPVVVFDSGLGGFSLGWIYVQELLQGELQVCAYDRAGYGWSDPGPPPRDTDHIVDELTRLLEVSGKAPPYFLVGHSFGGYNVQYLAKLHPELVAGVVLVDSSHPDQAERLPVLPAETRVPDSARLITHFNPSAVFRYYPQRHWNTVGNLMGSFKAIQTQQRELMNFVMSGHQVKQAGDMPAVPLVVISRGKRVWPEDPMGDALEQAWSAMQQELASSVIDGQQVVAEDSGHLVHLERPQLVADVIRRLVRQVCSHQLAHGGQTATAIRACGRG